MQMIRKTAVVLAMVAFATAASGACYTYDVPGGTTNLFSSTQINSTDRFLIHQGTVILNEGASIICGGDYESVCNYLGVDRNNMAAALIVNGGTFWCSSSKGKGCLKISANNNNQEATLTINSGSVTVDDCILTCTYWNGNNGSTGRGIINMNGGALTVGTLWLGANTDSTGSTEVYLAGGELAAKSIGFLSRNQQIFKFQGGTVKARQANVFSVVAYSGAKGRTIEAVADTVSTFDNSGFNQTLPPLTGTGTLRLTGTGTFSFSEKVLSYGLDLAGTAVSLGTASADIPCLELGGKLAVSGPTVVNVTLPEGASGRFPIFANCGAANAADVSANLLHPQGTFVLDGTTVYLDTTVSRVLIYSDAAGGDDTPTYSDYPYARFLESAGAFTVNGDGPLTLTDSGTVLSVESAVTQTINRALTFLSPSAAIDTVADSTLVLKGAFTATAPVKKGPGTLVLDPTSAWTIAGFYAEEGTVDLAGRTCTGMLWLTGNGAGRTVTFRNGTWLHGEPEGYQKGRLDFLGYDVHFGEGFNLTFTNTTGRMAVGYGTETPRAEAQVFLDPGCGTVTLRGNTSDCCNFIGVDKAATSRVFVNGGTLHVTSDNAGGTLRIAAGANASSTVGQLTVAGGELKVDNDLTLATLFDRMNGGKGTAEFDLESGVARIGNLHLGASSSNTGKGTIRLTGGDLHVMMLKCWGYCAQTLLCDGATIHAVQDSNSSQPFLTALAGADGYTRTYEIGANGLTLDTAGFATMADLPFTGTGTLTVTGEGSLTYTATAPLAANVAVSSGATLALANRRTLSETVSLAPDATLKVAAVETEPLVFTNAITLAAGAKIEVDVSDIESAQTSLSAADFILPAESNILDFVTLKDREDVPRYVTSVDPDGDGRTVRIMLADRTTPCFAVWTGRGDPANAHDTDNWECRNAHEEIVPDVLPMNLTVVRLNGPVAFSVPADHPLTIREFAFGGPVTLSGDCDWRGFGTVEIPEGAVIDLHGHKLYLSDLTGAGTITDASVDYVPLEYIESTGSQWIDTGYTHTAETRVDCVISASAKQQNKFAAVFGAGSFNNAATWDSFAFCALYNLTSGDCPELTRSGKQQTGSGFFYGEKVNLSCVGGLAEWSKVADPSQTGCIINSDCTVDDGTFTMAIFDIHNATGVQGAGALMKLYSFQIREGEELKCYFVPMRRVSDGAAGLLDLTDGVFHPSQRGNLIGVEPADSNVTYGELHLDVAPLRTLDIATVTLSGALKVVKDGAGTLTYTKAGLSYCGGTHVASGTFKLSQTGSNIGAPGTEIAIDAGATFDFNGKYDAHTYEYVLNGGTIANTGADVSSTICCLRHLRLTADSTMDVPKRFGFVGTAYSQTRLDLAGHTLTVMADWDFYLSNVEMTAGTFKMTGGFLRIAEGDIRAPETDFDLDCVLTHMTNGDVRNFTYRKDATKTQPGTYLAYNTGKMRVHGVFTPVTDYFHNVEMQNGSTLDLSGRTGPWSLLSLNGENGNATNKKGTHLVTFVSNATIYIKLGRRHLGRNEKLLGWDASSKPANLDTLTFEQAPDSRRGGGFYVGTDGLYFRSGFAIFVR